MQHEPNDPGLDKAPHDILSAMSKIQNFFVFESAGQSMNPEMFTWELTKGYMNVGMKLALLDSLIWTIVYIFVGSIVYFVQENYLTEKTMDLFFWQLNGSPLYILTKLSSFGHMFYSTVLCVMVSRYYTGVVAKKAINTLFLARASFLFSFALLTFFVLGGVYKLLTAARMENLYYIIAHVDKGTASKVYIFFHDYFRRALFEASITALIAPAVSVVVPYLTIIVFRGLRKKKVNLGLDPV